MSDYHDTLGARQDRERAFALLARIAAALERIAAALEAPDAGEEEG